MENQSYPVKEIYLFRHGQSQANAERFRKILFPRFFSLMLKVFGFFITVETIKLLDKVRGFNNKYPRADRDIPLEELGKTQAELTGKILAERNILPDIILASDFMRTRQTTDGILLGIEKITGISLSNRVLFSKLIIERDGGHEAGYPLSYYPVLFPQTNELYRTSSKLDFRPPSGESIRDVRYNRIPELKHVLNALNFKTLFIVGHGVTNSTIVSLLTDIEIENVQIGCPNLGVYRFTSDGKSDKWLLDPSYSSGKTIDKSIPFSG